MYFKKVIIGFFILAFLHANVFATDQLETSGGLTGAPDWVFQNNSPYSTVGSAAIKNGDFDLARAEAIDKAKSEIVKQIEVSAGNVSDQVKKDIEQIVNRSRVASFWFNDKKVFVLVELPTEAISKIKKMMKKGSIDFSTIDPASHQSATKNEW